MQGHLALSTIGGDDRRIRQIPRQTITNQKKTHACIRGIGTQGPTNLATLFTSKSIPELPQ
jgi:hypothetical protein